MRAIHPLNPLKIVSACSGGRRPLSEDDGAGRIGVLGGHFRRRRLLGWESRRHVGDMSARQPKVGTFGQQAPDEPTQIHSRHIVLCQGLPTFSKFSQVPEVHTE